MKKIIVLLGIPGSGKGTQAKKIAENHNYAHISTGNLLRDLLKDPKLTEEEKKIAEIMKEGKLVPDELVYRLAFVEIEKQLQEKDGVVLDGAIRNVEQAKAYTDFFKKNNLYSEVFVLEIELTDEEARGRLLKRHEGRSDDVLSVINKRLIEQGNQKVRPVADYYKNLGIWFQVDGNKSIEKVGEEIEEILNK